MRNDDNPITAMPHMVGAVIVILMLLVFHQVLTAAVQQGASNNIAYTQRGEANWHCRAERGKRAREDCISQRVGSFGTPAAPLLSAIDTENR